MSIMPVGFEGAYKAAVTDSQVSDTNGFKSPEPLPRQDAAFQVELSATAHELMQQATPVEL